MTTAEDRPRRVLDLLKLTEEYFRQKGVESPRVDAEILLAHVLRCKRIDLYIAHDRPLSENELNDFRNLVRKRASGAPVQHLTGEQEFYALRMQVTEKTLIPRPETEILVERIFRIVAPEGAKESFSIAEIGTGSGAIAIALAKGWPACRVFATDLSMDALEIAKGNARCHGVEDRLVFLHGDLFEPLEDRKGSFDLLVSNPPYVAEKDLEHLQPEVRDHEPHLALDGGPDGLEIVRRLIAKAPTVLRPGGRLFLEIGSDQGVRVREILGKSGDFDEIEIFADLTGRDRVAYGRRIVGTG